MQRASSARVRFGGFELNLPTGELWNGNTKVVLQEQPLQILRMLIERDGELLLREEIKKKFWPNDTVVEFDHSINAAIKNLRRALGDSAEEPRFIQTFPRRGYRLMVPVEHLGADDSSASPSGEAGGTAVLSQCQPGLIVRVASRGPGDFAFLIWEHIREAHFRAEGRRSSEAALREHRYQRCYASWLSAVIRGTHRSQQLIF